ncbi:MAG: hydrogenase/urease maturation nickel metallochaperone HypA [Rhodospirillales bacterium]|nr:hydrogenase/urease maturation nickel metallochaperone HypA [Rhodospirillales bacterium]
MHEMGLVRDLVHRVAEAAAANGAVRIEGVTVRLGALSHLSAAHFCEHFEAESHGTPAEGARLTIIESSDESDPAAQHLLLESLDLEV